MFGKLVGMAGSFWRVRGDECGRGESHANERQPACFSVRIALDSDMTDPRSIQRFMLEMTSATARGMVEAVIDCSAVVKIDSGAVAAIIQVARRVQCTGGRAEIRNVRGRLARMLEIYRLIPVLRMAGVSVYMV